MCSRLHHLSLLLLALMASGPAWAAPSPEPARDSVRPPARPNIVLLVADDLAPQLCNFMPEGRGKGLTPNLDALAADGVVLTNMHSPSPICTPSRFCIFSGKYASRATNPEFLRDTERNGGQTAVGFNTHLATDKPNVAKYLREAGYITGIVGKNHVVDVPGLKRLKYSADASDPKVQEKLRTNAEHLEQAFHAAGFDYAQGLYHGNPDADGIRDLAAHNQEWITDAARRFIADSAKKKDRPFFLYMATTIPHGPHEAERSWQADPRITPEGFLDEDAVPASQADRSTIPDRLTAAKVHGWNRENVLWLDDAVGAVIDELEKQGVKENTTLVFLSDHGTEAKGSVYRRGTQTVALIWKDGGFAVGPVLDQPLMLPDLGPTILGWAGVEVDPDDFDGRDMGPVLMGQPTGELSGDEEGLHDSLYFEVGFTRAVQKDGLKYVALRNPQWATDLSVDEREKLLDTLIDQLEQRGRPVPTRDPMAPFSHLTVVPGGADAEQVSIGKHPGYFDADQLYDLSADPNEQKNLIDDPAYADRLAGLKALLNQRVTSLPGHFAEFGVETETQPQNPSHHAEPVGAGSH